MEDQPTISTLNQPFAELVPIPPPKTLLFFTPKMRQLANEITQYQDRKYRHEKIELGEISWKNFADTFPDTEVLNTKALRNARIIFLMSIENQSEVFGVLSTMLRLAQLASHGFMVILPYFPTGTMERRDREGTVATASSLATFISAGMPPAGPGTVRLVMYDVHALPIMHFFGPNVSPYTKSATRILKDQLQGRKDISIVFPDEGSYKRFKSMFEDEETGAELFPFVVCSKVRKGSKRVVTIREGEVSGRNLVIIDDLIHTGGTLIECRNMLVAHGAKTVGVWATHSVMENKAWERFENAGFSFVWTTKSCPTTAAKLEGRTPFHVFSLAGSIARVILGIETTSAQ